MVLLQDVCTRAERNDKKSKIHDGLMSSLNEDLFPMSVYDMVCVVVVFPRCVDSGSRSSPCRLYVYRHYSSSNPSCLLDIND